MRTLAVSPSSSVLGHSKLGPSHTWRRFMHGQDKFAWYRFLRQLGNVPIRLADLGCAVLLCVDVFGNNWELINYVGNGKKFLTPLLDVESTDDMEVDYAFPVGASPNQVSKIGRFMLDTTLTQILNRDGTSYFLSLGSFKILDSRNDNCGQMVATYPIPNASVNSTVRVGNVKDSITYIRGNTLSHWFSDTKTLPLAPPGSNDATLRAMNYVPARVMTDMRLTVPLVVPPPGQVVQVNLSVYDFRAVSFCTGCHPATETGQDTCTISYTYNDTTTSLTILSSKAIIGTDHDLGMIFVRHWGPIASWLIRGLVVLISLGAFFASRKTVRWTEPCDLSSAWKRLIHLVAPTLYRHPSYAFDYSYLCFNSDKFVLLYTVAVMLDEDMSMIFSRTLCKWYKNTNTDMWIEFRLMALSFRWLWLNCLLVKLLKWLINYVTQARHTGSNVLLGWLTFSSVTWIYLGVAFLFQRNTFIDYGNSVRVELSSTTQNLDGISVNFFDSWYIRAAGSLLVGILANLVAILTMDHVLNRRWWRTMAKNSLGRQHMYNSTSILCETDTVFVPKPGYTNAVVDIKARALCTIQWFFSSHLVCFGLPEQPSVVRQIVATKLGKTPQHHGDTTATKSSINSRRMSNPVDAIPAAASLIDETSQVSESPGDPASRELHLLVQDRDGRIRLHDADKRELQALAMEVKILRDSSFFLG
ncbi:hypothetical protein AC1031_009855 [Aphanomyces cochlioides]|nr:hypothetical protein AC1031_009855 [Aphanomyces cochlioides]